MIVLHFPLTSLDVDNAAKGRTDLELHNALFRQYTEGVVDPFLTQMVYIEGARHAMKRWYQAFEAGMYVPANGTDLRRHPLVVMRVMDASPTDFMMWIQDNWVNDPQSRFTCRTQIIYRHLASLYLDWKFKGRIIGEEDINQMSQQFKNINWSKPAFWPGLFGVLLQTKLFELYLVEKFVRAE